ncbi:hypothetical protein UC35_05010 [Ramlibacter tataouinensis]|uniref:Uncharacterized protein n=1 Tax=Ramlibacter tataouinensis TaxID=94132 RepID=A0A127JR46_9BURK|nr:hypothetical protein UC35_05010 [Ramlibacter tataouinensis]
MQQGAPARACVTIRAEVPVDEIRIQPAGAGEVTVALSPPRVIDLLDPGTGVLEKLQLPPLTADAVDVRLRVAGDGAVRLEDGTMAPLRVPPALRLVGDFRLAAGMAADLVVQGFDRCGAIQASGAFFMLSVGDVPASVRAVQGGFSAR